MGRPEKDLGVMQVGPYLIPLELGKKWMDKMKKENKSQRAWLREQIEKYVGGEMNIYLTITGLLLSGVGAILSLYMAINWRGYSTGVISIAFSILMMLAIVVVLLISVNR